MGGGIVQRAVCPGRRGSPPACRGGQPAAGCIPPAAGARRALSSGGGASGGAGPRRLCRRAGRPHVRGRCILPRRSRAGGPAGKRSFSPPGLLPRLPAAVRECPGGCRRPQLPAAGHHGHCRHAGTLRRAVWRGGAERKSRGEQEPSGAGVQGGGGCAAGPVPDRGAHRGCQTAVVSPGVSAGGGGQSVRFFRGQLSVPGIQEGHRPEPHRLAGGCRRGAGASGAAPGTGAVCVSFFSLYSKRKSPQPMLLTNPTPISEKILFFVQNFCIFWAINFLRKAV